MGSPTVGSFERHLANGTEINGTDRTFGSTPMYRAALAGRADAIEPLARRGGDANAVDQDGANVNAENHLREKPLDGAVVDVETMRFLASILQVRLDENGLAKRKAGIAEYLKRRGATSKTPSVLGLLMQRPLFNHLWLLWWLAIGYAAVSAVGTRRADGGSTFRVGPESTYGRPNSWFVRRKAPQ